MALSVFVQPDFYKNALDKPHFAIFLDLDIYKAHLDFAVKYEEMGREKRALKEYIAAYEIDPRDVKIKEKIDILKIK